MKSKTIEEKRNSMSPAPKTDRRHNGQSETQRFASTENFALFTLRGIQSHISCERIKEFVSPEAVTLICVAAEQEIDRIKSIQELRKEKKYGKA